MSRLQALKAARQEAEDAEAQRRVAEQRGAEQALGEPRDPNALSPDEMFAQVITSLSGQGTSELADSEAVKSQLSGTSVASATEVGEKMKELRVEAIGMKADEGSDSRKSTKKADEGSDSRKSTKKDSFVTTDVAKSPDVSLAIGHGNGTTSALVFRSEGSEDRQVSRPATPTAALAAPLAEAPRLSSLMAAGTQLIVSPSPSKLSEKDGDESPKVRASAGGLSALAAVSPVPSNSSKRLEVGFGDSSRAASKERQGSGHTGKVSRGIVSGRANSPAVLGGDMVVEAIHLDVPSKKFDETAAKGTSSAPMPADLEDGQHVDAQKTEVGLDTLSIGPSGAFSRSKALAAIQKESRQMDEEHSKSGLALLRKAFLRGIASDDADEEMPDWLMNVSGLTGAELQVQPLKSKKQEQQKRAPLWWQTDGQADRTEEEASAGSDIPNWVQGLMGRQADSGKTVKFQDGLLAHGKGLGGRRKTAASPAVFSGFVGMDETLQISIGRTCRQLLERAAQESQLQVDTKTSVMNLFQDRHLIVNPVPELHAGRRRLRMRNALPGSLRMGKKLSLSRVNELRLDFAGEDPSEAQAFHSKKLQRHQARPEQASMGRRMTVKAGFGMAVRELLPGPPDAADAEASPRREGDVGHRLRTLRQRHKASLAVAGGEHGVPLLRLFMSEADKVGEKLALSPSIGQSRPSSRLPSKEVLRDREDLEGWQKLYTEGSHIGPAPGMTIGESWMRQGSPMPSASAPSRQSDFEDIPEEELVWHEVTEGQRTLKQLRSCHRRLLRCHGNLDKVFAIASPTGKNLTQEMFREILESVGFRADTVPSMFKLLLNLVPVQSRKSAAKAQHGKGQPPKKKWPHEKQTPMNMGEQASLSQQEFLDAMRLTAPVRSLLKLRARLRKRFASLQGAIKAWDGDGHGALDAADFRDFLASVGVLAPEAHELFNKMAEHIETAPVSPGEVEITRAAFEASLVHAEGIAAAARLRRALARRSAGSAGRVGLTSRATVLGVGGQNTGRMSMHLRRQGAGAARRSMARKTVVKDKSKGGDEALGVVGRKSRAACALEVDGASSHGGSSYHGSERAHDTSEEAATLDVLFDTLVQLLKAKCAPLSAVTEDEACLALNPLGLRSEEVEAILRLASPAGKVRVPVQDIAVCSLGGLGHGQDELRRRHEVKDAHVSLVSLDEPMQVGRRSFPAKEGTAGRRRSLLGSHPRIGSTVGHMPPAPRRSTRKKSSASRKSTLLGKRRPAFRRQFSKTSMFIADRRTAGKAMAAKILGDACKAKKVGLSSFLSTLHDFAGAVSSGAEASAEDSAEEAHSHSDSESSDSEGPPQRSSVDMPEVPVASSSSRRASLDAASPDSKGVEKQDSLKDTEHEEEKSRARRGKVAFAANLEKREVIEDSSDSSGELQEDPEPPVKRTFSASRNNLATASLSLDVDQLERKSDLASSPSGGFKLGHRMRNILKKSKAAATFLSAGGRSSGAPGDEAEKDKALQQPRQSVTRVLSEQLPDFHAEPPANRRMDRARTSMWGQKRKTLGLKPKDSAMYASTGSTGGPGMFQVTGHMDDAFGTDKDRTWSFKDHGLPINLSVPDADGRSPSASSSSSAMEEDPEQAEERRMQLLSKELAEAERHQRRSELFNGQVVELEIATAKLLECHALLLRRHKGSLERAWDELAGSRAAVLGLAALQDRLARLSRLNPLDTDRIAQLLPTIVEQDSELGYREFLSLLSFASPVPSLLAFRTRLVQRYGTVDAAFRVLGFDKEKELSVDLFDLPLRVAGITSADAKRLFRAADALQPKGPTSFLYPQAIRQAIDNAHVMAWLELLCQRIGGHATVQALIGSGAPELQRRALSPTQLEEPMARLGFPASHVPRLYDVLEQQTKGQVTVMALLRIMDYAFADLEQGASARAAFVGERAAAAAERDGALARLARLRQFMVENFANYQEAYEAFGAEKPTEGVLRREWDAARASFGFEDPAEWSQIFHQLLEWQSGDEEKDKEKDKNAKAAEPRLTLAKIAEVLNQLAPCSSLTALRTRLIQKFTALTKAWVHICGKERVETVGLARWQQALLDLSVRCADAGRLYYLMLATGCSDHCPDKQLLSRSAFLVALRGPSLDANGKMLDIIQRLSRDYGPMSRVFEVAFPPKPLGLEVFEDHVVRVLHCSRSEARTLFLHLDTGREGVVAIGDLLEMFTAVQASYLPYAPILLLQEGSSSSSSSSSVPARLRFVSGSSASCDSLAVEVDSEDVSPTSVGDCRPKTAGSASTDVPDADVDRGQSGSAELEAVSPRVALKATQFGASAPPRSGKSLLAVGDSDTVARFRGSILQGIADQLLQRDDECQAAQSAGEAPPPQQQKPRATLAPCLAGWKRRDSYNKQEKTGASASSSTPSGAPKKAAAERHRLEAVQEATLAPALTPRKPVPLPAALRQLVKERRIVGPMPDVPDEHEVPSRARSPSHTVTLPEVPDAHEGRAHSRRGSQSRGGSQSGRGSMHVVFDEEDSEEDMPISRQAARRPSMLSGAVPQAALLAAQKKAKLSIHPQVALAAAQSKMNTATLQAQAPVSPRAGAPTSSAAGTRSTMAALSARPTAAQAAAAALIGAGGGLASSSPRRVERQTVLGPAAL